MNNKITNKSFFKIEGQTLSWFVLLRWCSVCGQLFVISTAFWWLEGDLKIIALLVLVSLAFASNLVLHFISRRRALSQNALQLVMLFDALILTGLLYYSGGPSNPFSIIYLVYIVLAAVLLDKKSTWIFSITAALLYGVLFFFSSENNAAGHLHHHGATDSSYSYHLQGMWIAFVIAAFLISYFLTKIIDSLRSAQAKLNLLEIRSVQQQRLAALTTLAAGAAHELGTPLASIALAASEMENDLKNQPELSGGGLLADAELIKAEAFRCKKILEQMSLKAGTLHGEMPAEFTAESFFKSLIAELTADKANRLQVNLICDRNEKFKFPQQAVKMALVALINNAFEASSAAQQVTLTCSLEASLLKIMISDQGSGVPEEMQSRLGEPFFTTKGNNNGMGLGVFIARLTAEQLGGNLKYDFSKSENYATAAIFQIKVNEIN